MILVLATDHPERDQWVDEQARAEAAASEVELGPYQGVAVLPTGAPVHLFGNAEEAEAMRRQWTGSA